MNFVFLTRMLRNSGLIAIVMAAMLSQRPSLVQAQPVSKNSSIKGIQQKIKALQWELERVQQENSQLKRDTDSSRVKSVGNQRKYRRIMHGMDEPLQIRLYDLSDIFVASPSYTAVNPNDLVYGSAQFPSAPDGGTGGGGGFGGGAFGGGGGGVFRIASSATPANAATASRRLAAPQMAAPGALRSMQVSMKQMVAAVKETVEPSRWGREEEDAKLQELGNVLLITATPSMHDQINALFNLVREHWGKLRTISVQTYWIRSEIGQAKALLNDKHQSEIGAGVVTESTWTEYFKKAKTENRLVYAATLTGHNNQTLYALSGQQRRLTVGAVAMEASEILTTEDGDQIEASGVGGLLPVHQFIHEGPIVQVTPSATRGGNFVVVDLRAKLNEPLPVEKGAATETVTAFTRSGKSVSVQLDAADFCTYRLNTTVRCPKERVVLAGSLADRQLPDGAGQGESTNSELYVFVKTTVHTIDEDQSDWEPPKKRTTDTQPAAKGDSSESSTANQPQPTK